MDLPRGRSIIKFRKVPSSSGKFLMLKCTNCFQLPLSCWIHVILTGKDVSGFLLLSNGLEWTKTRSLVNTRQQKARIRSVWLPVFVKVPIKHWRRRSWTLKLKAKNENMEKKRKNKNKTKQYNKQGEKNSLGCDRTAPCSRCFRLSTAASHYETKNVLYSGSHCSPSPDAPGLLPALRGPEDGSVRRSCWEMQI